MLRKFAAAMLATALIAGPALAAEPAATAPAAPVTTATAPQPQAKPATVAKHATVTKSLKHHAKLVKKNKTIRHARVHSRTHVAHFAKPAKHAGKITSKTSVKMVKPAKSQA